MRPIGVERCNTFRNLPKLMAELALKWPEAWFWEIYLILFDYIIYGNVLFIRESDLAKTKCVGGVFSWAPRFEANDLPLIPGMCLEIATLPKRWVIVPCLLMMPLFEHGFATIRTEILGDVSLDDGNLDYCNKNSPSTLECYYCFVCFSLCLYRNHHCITVYTYIYIYICMHSLLDGRSLHQALSMLSIRSFI